MNTKTKAMLTTAALLEKSACTEKKYRPLFHLSPKTGWMNDPNGLCQFDGTYHIYFQYSPFDTKPGINYWGHFATKDFISYDYFRPALCVDENFDCHGVYSGSAITDKDGITVFYTGNVKQAGDYDYTTAGREHNTISAFSKDGINFEEKKLLMTNSAYPADCTCHVRDPKVWIDDGRYEMVLGSRRRDDVGEVLVFVSDDKEKWELQNRITTDEKFGYMWECPDIFTLGEKTFLAVSPQGVESEGYRYNNIYQSGYFTIEGDYRTAAKPVDFKEYDHGFDFYAPQSFVDENGRRIMIGWFGLPDLDGLYENPTTSYGWMHMLTCPRELSVDNEGNLCQYPVSELLSGENTTLNIAESCELSDLNVFRLAVKLSHSSDFEITIKNDCHIIYKDGVFTLSFGESGYGRTSRSAEIVKVSDLLILCDTSSVEIFINKGKDVFSSRFYPNDNINSVSISGIDGEISYGEMKSFIITDKSI